MYWLIIIMHIYIICLEAYFDSGVLFICFGVFFVKPKGVLQFK